MTKVYTAGPEGFNQAGRDFYFNTLLSFLEILDLEILSPWAKNYDEDFSKANSEKPMIIDLLH